MNSPKTSSRKKLKSKSVVDFQSVSLSCLKKYRRQYHIRIKPTVPKTELAAAVAEHFAAIPEPEEDETITEFFRALHRNEPEDEKEKDREDEGFASTAKNSPLIPSIPRAAGGKKKIGEKESSMKIVNEIQSNPKKNAKKVKAEQSTASINTLHM